MAADDVRVLVVDDDMFSAELAAMALEEEGFDVVLAEGGMDALEKVAEDPGIAVIISDMHMPLITGAELFDELREQAFMQPFVLLTADAVAALQMRYPAMDAIVAKDEAFQETLPKVVALLVSARMQEKKP